MKLYVGVLSLFSAKVRIALAEKGIEPQLVTVGWSRERRYLPHHPDVVALNPKRQVPVLVDGEVAVYDSTQIFEYLEERVPEPPLLPKELADRVRCRELEAAGDEIWFPFVWDLIEARFYADGSGSDAKAKAAQEGLQELYAELDKWLGSRRYLVDRFSFADISVFIQVNAAATLGVLPGEHLKSVREWVDRVASRPTVSPILGEMSQAAVAALRPPD